MRRFSNFLLMLALLAAVSLAAGGCDLVRELAGDAIREIVRALPAQPAPPASPPPPPIDPLVQEMARLLTASSGSEQESLERIYDWVTANISYDTAKTLPYTIDSAQVLRTRTGVCGDYAYLTAELLQAAGLEAEVKTGTVAGSGGPEEHAWLEAVAGGIRYALDPTWGAGTVHPETRAFSFRPTRLYLTTPEELARLHGDTAYREQRVLEEMRARAGSSLPQAHPDLEEALHALFNGERRSAGLAPLALQADLLNEARRAAREAAEREIRGESWAVDLQAIGDRLNRSAPYASRLASHTFLTWRHGPVPAEELYRSWMGQGGGNRHELLSGSYTALAVGVVRQGDLVVLCALFVEYR